MIFGVVIGSVFALFALMLALVHFGPRIGTVHRIRRRFRH